MICKKRITTGANNGGGTACTSAAHTLTPICFWWNSCSSIYMFLFSIMENSVSLCVIFLLAIVLSVLHLMVSNYSLISNNCSLHGIRRV